jgi:hypothetical protein
MQAAIQFINDIDLNQLHIPKNAIEYVQLDKKRGPKREHVLHETFVSNELEHAAQLFSNVIWGRTKSPSTTKTTI